MAIRFVIAEDNELFRKTFINMLVSVDGLYDLAGEATDGQAAIDLVERRRPDLLILDLRMPKLDGFGVMKKIRKKQPELKILVLTMDPSKITMARALDHGADAYCTKSSLRGEIFRALDIVMKGETYVCDADLE